MLPAAKALRDSARAAAKETSVSFATINRVFVPHIVRVGVRRTSQLADLASTT